MIHHVVPTLHKELGGVDVAVRALCAGLQRAGEEFMIHTLEAPRAGLAGIEVRKYPLAPLSPMRLGWSPVMKRRLFETVEAGDIVHNHSLWAMPNIYAGDAARRKRALLINAPHGTLTGWARGRSPWKKRLSLALGQQRALDATACFHVSAADEVGQLRDLGYLQPVAVIPNGVEIPAERALPVGAEGAFTVLFLARLHPTKGVETLLRAWRRFAEHHRGAKLVVAGPDEGGYGAEMAQLAADLGIEEVSFAGPVTGEAKGRLYDEADVYVLPTQSENFGLTIAEALAHGTPVITTKGAPWAGLLDHCCGWWIDGQEDVLAAALREAAAMDPAERAAMGRRGREWMSSDFSWEKIAGMTQDLYRWLEERAERPAWVYVH